ncbi:MAG: glycosyltransferase family 2 protein, partial [Bryobacteraceae bacterium]
FDERLGPGTAFPAAEDNDLGLRLLRAGYRIHYVPEAVVDHLAWRTASDYLPFKWRYGRGQGAYYAKHMMLGDTRIWGRMGKDLAEQTFPLLWRIWRSRRQACGQAVFAAGLVTGCLEWMWTEGFDRKGKSGWNLRL